METDGEHVSMAVRMPQGLSDTTGSSTFTHPRIERCLKPPSSIMSHHSEAHAILIGQK